MILMEVAASTVITLRPFKGLTDITAQVQTPLAVSKRAAPKQSAGYAGKEVAGAVTSKTRPPIGTEHCSTSAGVSCCITAATGAGEVALVSEPQAARNSRDRAISVFMGVLLWPGTMPPARRLVVASNPDRVQTSRSHLLLM